MTGPASNTFASTMMLMYSSPGLNTAAPQKRSLTTAKTRACRRPPMYWNVLHLNAERFIPILTLLTEPDTVPVLIHCVAGRDRTGVIVALIRAAVGVPEVFIAEDFALSSQLMALALRVPKSITCSATSPTSRAKTSSALWRTRPETMRALFARIRAEYASTAGLLDGLGVLVSLIASLHPSPTTAEETAHSSAGLTAGCSSTMADPPGRQPMRQSTS